MQLRAKHIVLNIALMTLLMVVVAATVFFPIASHFKVVIIAFAFILVMIYCVVVAEKISSAKEKEDYYIAQSRQAEMNLFIQAIRTAYPFIMVQNLTKDTSRIDLNDTEGKDREAGSRVDEVLYNVLKTIPEPIHRAEFERKFSRQALIDAYNAGETTLRCCIKQKINEETHWMNVAVILFKGEDEDLYSISMTRSIDEELEKANMFDEARVNAEMANKAKSNFLTAMSHEIRTPINAVLGMNTMILREAKQENIKEYARDIQNAANALLSIINDILDFSKIESGRLEVVPSNYDLGPLLNDIVNVWEPKAHEKGLEFKLEINHETPALLVGDGVRIKQILINIITNAIKYTEKGSVTVKIDFDRIGKELMDLIVSVSDTGIGIKPESLENIFSTRYSFEENNSIEGTGLGLSITQNLLSKMGSKLRIESTYGAGSTFSFKVEQKIWGEGTLGNTADRLAKQGGNEDAENYHAPKAKLLVIDDVEMNIVVVRSLLKRIGCSIDSALSGEDGIELARKNKYDIIFIDAMMPKMNGTETMERIKADCEINKNAPMVVLTANAVQGARDEYLREGFTDYLAKPVEGKLLEEMIKHYLPKDLVVYGDDYVKEEESAPAGFEGELAQIDQIEGIDVNAGITSSADESIYKKVCRMFFDSAAERIKMIEDYFRDKDIQNYTIQVHALKSSARLLGAQLFSDAAKDLEMAGRENDLETIERKTPALIEEYRRIFKALGKVYDDGEDDSRKEIDPGELKGMLTEMREALEAFDHDTSGMIMDALEEYKMPEDFAEAFAKLKVGRAEVDRDGMIKELDNYLRGTR